VNQHVDDGGPAAWVAASRAFDNMQLTSARASIAADAETDAERKRRNAMELRASWDAQLTERSRLKKAAPDTGPLFAHLKAIRS